MKAIVSSRTQHDYLRMEPNINADSRRRTLPDPAVEQLCSTERSDEPSSTAVAIFVDMAHNPSYVE